MAKKTNKKGFTLTELIVVIVIIGILAAVLTPSILNYIDKARLASDQSDARNLTMLLSVQSFEENVSYYDAEYVINVANQNGYSLVAKAKGYAYWYDSLNNKVEVLKVEDVNAIDRSIIRKNLSTEKTNQALYNPQNKVRNFAGGNHLYIDQGKSNLTEAVNLLTSFLEKAIVAANSNERAAVTAKMEELYSEKIDKVFSEGEIKEYFLKFSPGNAVYINNNDFYTASVAEKYQYQTLLYKLDPDSNSYEAVSISESTETKYSALDNIVIDNKTTKLPIELFRVSFNLLEGSVYIPANVVADNVFKSFIEGINNGANNTVGIVLSNQEQNEAINELKSEYERLNKMILETKPDLSVTFDFKIKKDLLVIQQYNKKLIELDFGIAAEGKDIVNTYNSLSGIVKIDGDEKISVMFTKNGKTIMTEGSSFEINYSKTFAYSVCEVKIFDASGVLYAVGTLKYNY